MFKENEMKKYGEYRTKRLILKIFDEIEAHKNNGTLYQTRLDPPPADPRAAHEYMEEKTPKIYHLPVEEEVIEELEPNQIDSVKI